MPKKWKGKTPLTNNYINNRNSLINIEQLNMEIKETFWFGVGVGALAILAVLYLKSDKSEKKAPSTK